MKFHQLLSAVVVASSTAHAFMCNCYDANRPEIVASTHVCKEFGGSVCYDPAHNINGCILSHTITDADCARLYSKEVNGKLVPDPDFKANCEHFTGSCPK